MKQRARGPRQDPGRGRTPADFSCDDTSYRQWRLHEVTVSGRTLRMASKPGVLSHGELDPSAGLLLDNLDLSPSDTVVDLQCASGVVGTLAALSTPSGQVRMADRNLLSVQASRRTLAANDAANAQVFFSDGAAELPPDPADAAIVRLPKGRIPTLQLLWDAFHALRPGGVCYLAGGNDEGIKTALRQMEALFGTANVVGYRGGHRCGVAIRPDGPAPDAQDFDLPWLDHARFHEFTVDTRGGTYPVHSRPGVFSWDRLDRGSQALIETMELEDAGEVLEIGCGYGIVGVVASRLAPSTRVTMVDVDIEAVRSTERTIQANGVADRCQVLPSDVAEALAERRFDVVITNPPFHVGKATELETPAQFIRDAYHALRPGGRLFLVANRTLPYEHWIQACFGAYRTALDGREFKVLSARRRE